MLRIPSMVKEGLGLYRNYMEHENFTFYDRTFTKLCYNKCAFMFFGE